MQITLDIPDDIADRLKLQPSNISRRFLELQQIIIVKVGLVPPKSTECSIFHRDGKPINSSKMNKLTYPIVKQIYKPMSKP